MALAPQIALLRLVKDLNDTGSQRTTQFLSQPKLIALARKYEANLKKRHVDLRFNLFAIISDLYYRENFHSDILQAILDPVGKHQEKSKYLHLFLDFIRSHGAKVARSDYSNAQVVREEGRIDILIKDGTSHKAVIIENKINGAPDMPRQLPGYLETVTAKGYSCDAIIYLRLNGDARPDMAGWSQTDRQRVNALMKIIPAYAETAKDLLNGWILPCQKAALNPDAQHILRQYGELIKKLGSNIMNKPVMDNFYTLIMQGEHFKTALSVRDMLNDLILYRVERLVAHFQHDPAPFDDIGNWRDYDVYFTGCRWKDAHLGIDIGVSPESYALQFWEREAPVGASDNAKAILRKMGYLAEFAVREDRFTKDFRFPSQEQDLIDYVTTFKKKLAAAITPGA